MSSSFITRRNQWIIFSLGFKCKTIKIFVIWMFASTPSVGGQMRWLLVSILTLVSGTGDSMFSGGCCGSLEMRSLSLCRSTRGQPRSRGQDHHHFRSPAAGQEVWLCTTLLLEDVWSVWSSSWRVLLSSGRTDDDDVILGINNDDISVCWWKIEWYKYDEVCWAVDVTDVGSEEAVIVIDEEGSYDDDQVDLDLTFVLFIVAAAALSWIVIESFHHWVTECWYRIVKFKV